VCISEIYCVESFIGNNLLCVTVLSVMCSIEFYCAEISVLKSLFELRCYVMCASVRLIVLNVVLIISCSELRW